WRSTSVFQATAISVPHLNRLTALHPWRFNTSLDFPEVGRPPNVRSLKIMVEPVCERDIQGNDHPKTRAVSMTDIILHHYETSPYSEKVRLGLGLKGLAWESVEIPVIMPKPDLTALTGGYRKTPVLQIGADIYCDSQLIMRELERRHPTPSFYPAGHGAADALAWWAEKTTFSPAVSIAFAKRPDTLPEGFLEDRAKFSGRNIDPAAMMAAVPNLLDQLRAHFDWLNQML